MTEIATSKTFTSSVQDTLLLSLRDINAEYNGLRTKERELEVLLRRVEEEERILLSALAAAEKPMPAKAPTRQNQERQAMKRLEEALMGDSSSDEESRLVSFNHPIEDDHNVQRKYRHQSCQKIIPSIHHFSILFILARAISNGNKSAQLEGNAISFDLVKARMQAEPTSTDPCDTSWPLFYYQEPPNFMATVPIIKSLPTRPTRDITTSESGLKVCLTSTPRSCHQSPTTYSL
eukprot:scaffold23911_cov127-Cylindrotheca_fusiformis.AAC.4